MPFLINTEVKLSNIPNAGNGRFFSEDCEKDTIIRKQLIDSEELYILKPDSNLELINKHYLLNFAHSRPIEDIDDNCIYLNNPPLYTNHSKEPNIYFVYDKGEKFTITSKDVKKGEEMYQDYSNYRYIDWYEKYLEKINKKSLRHFGNELNKL